MSKRGPAPSATEPLTKRNASAAAKYYHKVEEGKDHPHSWYVQRARVYKRIRDTGKLPQQRTVDKYEIEIRDNKVIVPKDLQKAKTVVDWVPAPEPVVHARMEEPPVQVAPIPQGTITVPVSAKYLDDNYTLGNDANGERRKVGKKWRSDLHGIGNFLVKSGVMKNKTTGDFAGALNQYQKLIHAIENMKNSKTGNDVEVGTKLERLKIILTHLDNNPHLKKLVSPEAYKAYREAASVFKDRSNEKSANARENNSVYWWPSVMESLKRHFGEGSREYLYARVFNEVPIRNELKNIPFSVDQENSTKVHYPNEPTKSDNYVWRNPKNKNDIVIYINDFKTDAGVQPFQYKLSKDLCKLINKNMSERTSAFDKSSLFPFPFETHGENFRSLWVWFGQAIRDAGFPKYPYGKVKLAEKDETQNGTRHTVAAYRDTQENKQSSNPEPSGTELAKRMLHTYKTHVSTYQNSSFFDKPERPPL